MDKEKYAIQKIQYVHNLSSARLYEQYFNYLAKKDELDSEADKRSEAEDDEFFE